MCSINQSWIYCFALCELALNRHHQQPLKPFGECTVVMMACKVYWTIWRMWVTCLAEQYLCGLLHEWLSDEVHCSWFVSEIGAGDMSNRIPLFTRGTIDIFRYYYLCEPVYSFGVPKLVEVDHVLQHESLTNYLTICKVCDTIRFISSRRNLHTTCVLVSEPSEESSLVG